MEFSSKASKTNLIHKVCLLSPRVRIINLLPTCKNGVIWNKAPTFWVHIKVLVLRAFIQSARLVNRVELLTNWIWAQQLINQAAHLVNLFVSNHVNSLGNSIY